MEKYVQHTQWIIFPVNSVTCVFFFKLVWETEIFHGLIYSLGTVRETVQVSWCVGGTHLLLGGGVFEQEAGLGSGASQVQRRAGVLDGISVTWDVRPRDGVLILCQGSWEDACWSWLFLRKIHLCEYFTHFLVCVLKTKEKSWYILSSLSRKGCTRKKHFWPSTLLFFGIIRFSGVHSGDFFFNLD